MLTNWLSVLLNRLDVSNVSRRPRNPQSRTLNRHVASLVERLESRQLLSAITVNSVLDNTTSGDGLVTLREAIAAANSDSTTDLGQMGSGSDTISFDSSLNGQIITLSEGELAISSSLTIIGNGATNTVIDANNASRIFDVNDGDPLTTEIVTISGVTLQHATNIGDGNGGAIYNAESLSLSSSVLRENSAADGGGLFVARDSTAVITGCSISGNTASSRGGGFHIDGNLVLQNSTVANNIASTNGGGRRSRGSSKPVNSDISKYEYKEPRRVAYWWIPGSPAPQRA